ncbi:alpha/beta hydrolase [Nonomuraea mangrovi]|uniref:Alpha/beta hydrolase n=1 Tax=Nonomuraea mangrovi TaxID=2316207 RepID=A0ABW4T0B9_9ACTN
MPLPGWRRPVRRGLRVLGRALAGAGVIVLAPVLALATLAGLSTVAASPTVLLGAALAAFAAILFLGLLLLLPRPAARLPRWSRALAILGVESVVVWQVATATLHPLDPAAAPAPVAGQRTWTLPTGSTLAYVATVPKRPRAVPPVVFLHGGPGLSDLGGDARFFGALAAEGHAVYVYDQLGAGRSARLPDPRGYGLTRDVEDLEAIRAHLKAERLVLVGHSSGARLAAGYLARHPERVAKLVLSSPADLAPAPAGVTLARLDLARDRDLALTLLHPRVLAAYTLARVNPATAHAVVGDRELDTRFAGYPRLLAPPRRCASAGRTAARDASVGAYATLADRPTPAWVRQGITGKAVPVLVIKGACDHQSWSSATGYLHALARARLVYLPGAGHDAYRDQPAAYLAAVRAFLADRPLRDYTGDQPPPGYQGPP